jgi:hypothetical protein
MPTSHSEVWKRIIAYEKEIEELWEKYFDKKTSEEAKVKYWNRIQIIKDYHLPNLDKLFAKEVPFP